MIPRHGNCTAAAALGGDRDVEGEGGAGEGGGKGVCKGLDQPACCRAAVGWFGMRRASSSAAAQLHAGHSTSPLHPPQRIRTDQYFLTSNF